jgi:hypothetical protein
MRSKFLEYQIVLLLAQYGKLAVLAALAAKLETSEEQLMAQMQRPPAKARQRAKERRSFDVGSAVAGEDPAKAQLLRTLHNRYENRTFLPELRDVKRFFEQFGQAIGSVKSRAALLPKVMRFLAEREMSELESLTKTPTGSDYSSLGLISDEILRRGR